MNARTLYPLRSEQRDKLTVWIFDIPDPNGQTRQHEVISEEPPVYRGGSFYPKKTKKKAR